MGFGKFLKKVGKAVGKAATAPVKIGAKSVKATVKSAGRLAHGDVKGALREGARSIKDTAREAGDVAKASTEPLKRRKKVGKNLRTEGNEPGDAKFNMN